MKIALALLAAALALSTRAADTFVSADDFVQRYIGAERSHYSLRLSEPTERFVVGSIYPIADAAAKPGSLFILARLPDGHYRLDDHAGQGGDLDPGDRTDVEFIEVNGDRFYVQYNARKACGTVVTIYNFKKIRGSWRVTGSDNWDSECLANGDIGYKRKLSKNFLTGKLILQSYRNGKPAGTTTSSANFPPFFFRDFRPFDEKYGEQF